MPKITAAIAALLLALTLTGCGDDTASDTEPRAFAQSAEQAPAAGSAEPESEEAELSAEDEAFLAEVDQRTRPGTVLDQFTDAELIAAGHEGCAQIGGGIPIEDLRLVDGENPDEAGTWPDTSAVFNSALLNYCPELMEDID